MIEKTLTIPDVSCDHCKLSIEGALQDLTGVRSAEVDVPAKTVSLTYAEDEVNLEKIIDAITEVGYEVVH